MIRVLLLVAGSILLAAGLGYVLLFTGAHSHGAIFSIGNIQVEYETKARGTLSRERVGYVILSEDQPQAESLHSTENAPTRVTRTYLDAGRTNTITFSINPGQTVWIGKNRLIAFVPAPLQLSDLELIRKHVDDKALHGISSMDELTNALATLRARPTSAPNMPPRK
jgi:hypothetical protein